MRAQSVCLCHLVSPFWTDVHFVFLMHRKELRDRSGTGTARLAHLCLSNSSLFVGVDFTSHPGVDALLSNSERSCWVLFPNQDALNLSDPGSKKTFREAAGKKPVIFVLDGSWSCARALLGLNPRIAALPKVSLTVDRPSGFRFKRQPRPGCLSTIEAVNLVIDAVAAEDGNGTKAHSGVLTSVLDELVRIQESYHCSLKPE
jgi:DTW domain-containing protein YfiP